MGKDGLITPTDLGMEVASRTWKRHKLLTELSGSINRAYCRPSYMRAESLVSSPHPLHCSVRGRLTALGKWQASRKKFFLPVRVLSRKFREKFLALLKLKMPDVNQNLLNQCYHKEWVVYCKPLFKDAACIIEYLGRYTLKVAIYNNRILKLKNGSVTFKWRNFAQNRVATPAA